MTANEWLEVMKQASDFPKGMEKLIVKYGEMLIEEHDSKVKKLNEPAVSKSEGIERRNLLIDFGNRVVEIQNEHQCLLQNVEKEVDKYLKSINNC